MTSDERPNVEPRDPPGWTRMAGTIVIGFGITLVEVFLEQYPWAVIFGVDWVDDIAAMSWMVVVLHRHARPLWDSDGSTP